MATDDNKATLALIAYAHHEISRWKKFIGLKETRSGAVTDSASCFKNMPVL